MMPENYLSVRATLSVDLLHRQKGDWSSLQREGMLQQATDRMKMIAIAFLSASVTQDN
jgi:hypothetical protein